MGKRIIVVINMNMIFQVKADVHSVSGELIVSGLDSATSLIQVNHGDDGDAGDMVMLVMMT